MDGSVSRKTIPRADSSGEIPAAAQEQVLLERPFEAAVAALDVAVFLRRLPVRHAWLQFVMAEQVQVALRVRPLAFGPGLFAGLQAADDEAQSDQTGTAQRWACFSVRGL